MPARKPAPPWKHLEPVFERRPWYIVKGRSSGKFYVWHNCTRNYYQRRNIDYQDKFVCHDCGERAPSEIKTLGLFAGMHEQNESPV